MNPWLGMAVVAASFAAVMGAVKLAGRHWQLHPEVCRKLVHVGMGFVTLTFPWLFNESWAVWVLNGAFVVALSALRFVTPLRQRLGGVLGGVERQSWGEFYFPVAVAIIFTLIHEQRAFYVVPLLVLTLADAMAALIGIWFGHIKYRTGDGVKSIEGSLAFFATAAVSTFLPLRGLTDAVTVHIAVTAVSVGVLAMLVEAMSWRGLDNLFLPLATLTILLREAERTDTQLAVQTLVALGLLAFLLLWRRRTTLRDEALASVTLVLYVCYTVGGWAWLLPPLTVVLAYPLLPFRPQVLLTDVHGSWIVLAMIAPGWFWLFTERTIGVPGKFAAFTLAIAAQLAMAFLARWRRARPNTPLAAIIIGATATAWMFVVLPLWLLRQFPAKIFIGLPLAFGCLLATVSLFYLLNVRPGDIPNRPARWVIQSGLALAVSLAGLLPFFSP